MYRPKGSEEHTQVKLACPQAYNRVTKAQITGENQSFVCASATNSEGRGNSAHRAQAAQRLPQFITISKAENKQKKRKRHPYR
jgi:hypothetical protein